MISKSSSVLRNMGNKERRKTWNYTDFDHVALISDNSDDDGSNTENTKPVKKFKNKKKYKNKLAKKLSDPTARSNSLSRREVEQLDGFKPSSRNGNLYEEIFDPREEVLQNLKKKHGMMTSPSKRKTTRFSDSLEDWLPPQEVKGAKSAKSRARILRNSEIDESKV